MRIRSDVRLGFQVRELTIGSVLAKQAERWGDKTWITFLPSRLCFSFAEMESITNRIANGLLAFTGPRPHVATFFENCPEGLFAHLAAGKIGGVVAPVNAAARGEFLGYFIDLADAVAVIVEQKLFEHLAAILPALTRIRHVFVIPDEGAPAIKVHQVAGVAVHPFSALMSGRQTPPGVAVRFDDLAMLAFTSGTTGPSKASMHTQAKCLLNPIGHAESRGVRPHDVLYSCLPLFHTNALYATIYPALVTGASAVLSRRFSARSFWRDAQENGATLTNLLGSMANILWAQAPGPGDRAHTVRECSSVPVPSNVAEFEDRFGTRVGSVYGLSDFGSATILPITAPMAKAHSAGRPRPGWHVRVVDEDNFDVPGGQIGEIALRTDNLWEASLGYYKMPEKTLQSMRNGWFLTGDIGYLDDDCYLWFVDRKTDSMRRNGENISSFEVEQLILKHPAIEDVASFPLPGEMGEDEVAVAVVLKTSGGLSEGELIEHCLRNMSHFMVPRFVRIVTELPRTPTQKVEKYKLRRDAEADPSKLWDRVAAGITGR